MPDRSPLSCAKTTAASPSSTRVIPWRGSHPTMPGPVGPSQGSIYIDLSGARLPRCHTSLSGGTKRPHQSFRRVPTQHVGFWIPITLPKPVGLEYQDYLAQTYGTYILHPLYNSVVTEDKNMSTFSFHFIPQHSIPTILSISNHFTTNGTILWFTINQLGKHHISGLHNQLSYSPTWVMVHAKNMEDYVTTA